KTDVHQAIEQGCRDRFGNPLQAEELRAGCLDEEMYLQEYCCQFLSIASQWISPELFGANVDEEAHHSYPVGEYDRNLYAGWDVARNKDLSVIWFLERVGDVSVTRGVIEYRNVPTTDQTAEMDKLMPFVRRLVIGKGSMGLSIFETLHKRYGDWVEGVTFTLGVKEALAVGMKRRMEERKMRIPDTPMIRNSFRSVKKTVTATGQARFDAEHDAQFGHADAWWAACLAESAASQ